MAPSFGAVIRQAREVRGLSAVEAARAAGISAAYLSKLENGGVKKPSPHVLHQLSEALAVPYAELMRLNGYRLPGEGAGPTGDTVAAALFAAALFAAGLNRAPPSTGRPPARAAGPRGRVRAARRHPGGRLRTA